MAARALPRATLVRIFRSYLPSNARMSEEARDFLVDATLKFLEVLASKSWENAKKKRRITIKKEDIISALNEVLQ